MTRLDQGGRWVPGPTYIRRPLRAGGLLPLSSTAFARRIGLDRLVGYLAAWRFEGAEVEPLVQMPLQYLALWCDEDRGGIAVLGVRRHDEWELGHIPGARHLFAGEISHGSTPPTGEAESEAVICASGYRSSVVASLLQARGYHNLINVRGGMDAWIEAGLPAV